MNAGRRARPLVLAVAPALAASAPAHPVVGGKPVRVGGATRRGLDFSMHPNRQRENAGNVLDDVAIIQLDRPVTR